jgi:hypothetical protein
MLAEVSQQKTNSPVTKADFVAERLLRPSNPGHVGRSAVDGSQRLCRD